MIYLKRRNVAPDPLPSGTEFMPLSVRQFATYCHLGGLTSVPWSEDELSGREHTEDRDMIFRETLEEFRRTPLPRVPCIWEQSWPPRPTLTAILMPPAWLFEHLSLSVRRYPQ